MRVLVTGSRDHTDKHLIQSVLLLATVAARGVEEITLVHGGARGADALAFEIATEMGWTVDVFPADWETYGKRAGMIRNKEMVAYGADVCLAFPIGESRGTRHCMAVAREAGIPVKVFEGMS